MLISIFSKNNINYAHILNCITINNQIYCKIITWDIKYVNF